MIYSILSVLIIVISFLCFSILIIDFNGKISNKYTRGNIFLNSIKVFVPFICIFTLYALGIVYFYKSGNPLENIIPIELFDIFCATIKSLVFEVRGEKVFLLIDNNFIYQLTWWIAYPLCVFTSYISILNSLFHRFSNRQKVKDALRENCDIIIGTDYADIYKANSNNNLILWIDEQISKEKELELIKLNIPYIHKSFEVKNLLALPFVKRSIRRRKKLLKLEIKHYINNCDDYIDLLSCIIIKNIGQVLISANHNPNILSKVYSNAEMVYKFTEIAELKNIIRSIKISEDLDTRAKHLKELEFFFLEENNRKLIVDSVILILKEILKVKEYRLNLDLLDNLMNDSRNLLLKKLKEAYPFETDEIDYHFISFKDEEKNLLYLSEFKQFLESTKSNIKIYETRNYFLHIELSSQNLLSIQNKIQENQETVYLSPFLLFFNRYQLLSLKFNEEYPITKYLPNNFISDLGAISNTSLDIKYDLKLNDKVHVKTPYDKNINVIYLGFGKVSKELYDLSIMNNQFISYCDNFSITPSDRYHNHIVNYFAFDKETFNTTDKNNLFFKNRFDNLKDELNQDEYYHFPENVANFYAFNKDINDLETYKSLVKLLKYKKEDTYSKIIISLDNDLINIDYALKISMLLKQENINNYHIFVRLQKENVGSIELLNDKNITYFGFIDEVFNHEIIVKDGLMRLAKLTNKSYNKMKLSNTNWFKLSPIKQKSNLYASMNIRFKLNLLGYDYKKLTIDEFKDLTIDEIKQHKENLISLASKIKTCYGSYDDYLFFLKDKTPTPANILSFEEHSRWNAFYLEFGYIPMKKDDVKIIGNNIYKDDNNLKQHICLTTYQDLDLYHKQFASLMSEINELPFDTNLNNEQTYQYDYMLVNQFDSLFNNLEKNLLLLIKK